MYFVYHAILEKYTIINYYCFCNMHRNLLIWSYKLFLPKPWLELKIYSKEKKCHLNLFMILRIRFPPEFNNLKISLPENKYLQW